MPKVFILSNMLINETLLKILSTRSESFSLQISFDKISSIIFLSSFVKFSKNVLYSGFHQSI